MNKLFIITVSTICSWNFSFAQNPRPLGVLNISQEIELIHIDDKCGEWGGDKEIIKIYTKEYNGEIFADYKKTITNCSEPIETEKRNEVKLNSGNLKLVEESILQLINSKLSNTQGMERSGILNTIISKDSTFVIRDYPSIGWSKFNDLKNVILNK